jgi:Ca2+-binding EF-hand superfamily protein
MIMKTIVTNTAATCLLLAASLAAGAARTGDDLPPRSTRDVQIVFDSLDRNRDAKISRSEATLKGSVSKRFDGIDSNGDGYLSRQEFAARPSDERFE